VSRLILVSPLCSLPLPWQAIPTSNVGSEAVNPVVSTPHKLRSYEIQKSLSVSLVVMPPRHHQPALPSEIGDLQQNRYKRAAERGYSPAVAARHPKFGFPAGEFGFSGVPHGF